MIIPSPATAKKGGEDLLVLSLNTEEGNDVKYNNKSLKNIVLNMSKSEEKTKLSLVHPDAGEITGSESAVLRQLFLLSMPNKSIVLPTREIFQSKNLKDNNWMFIRCYKGTQEGMLSFPPVYAA